MKFGKCVVALLCAWSLLAGAGEAFAAKKNTGKPAKIEAEQDDRFLKGHQFLRPFGFPMAMPTTNVGVGLGYAYVNFKYDEAIDMIVVNEDEINVGGLNENLDFEVEFLDRFSLEFLLDGRAVVGADEASVLLAGGQALWMVQAIPKVMIYQNDKWGTCLSAGAGFTYDQGIQTSPAFLMVQLLENVVEEIEEISKSGNFTEDDLRDMAQIKLSEATIKYSGYGIEPALLIAQTLHPVFGVQLGIRYYYGLDYTVDAPELFGETVMEETDPPTALSIGGAGTFDLNPISRVHLGMKAEVDYEMEYAEDEDTDTLTFGGGVMYTGRKDLELGATLYNETFTTEDMDTSTFFMILNMRYFF